jgi:TonB family protein
MKNVSIALLLCLFLQTGFSQELFFDVHGINANRISTEELSKAKTMRDINPGYPSASWITAYVSSEVSVTGNGKNLKASGVNDILTPEQQKILKEAELGNDVAIDIKYKQVNTMTGNVENRTMHFSYSIVPETQAEFSGGYEKLKQHLKQNAINKIPGKITKDIQAVVRFTVNEKGEIADARISKSSGDEKTDQMLVEAISKMPAWKPAATSKGKKVKQEFEFTVGNGGC